jgi:hypothetical protein
MNLKTVSVGTGHSTSLGIDLGRKCRYTPKGGIPARLIAQAYKQIRDHEELPTSSPTVRSVMMKEEGEWTRRRGTESRPAGSTFLLAETFGGLSRFGPPPFFPSLTYTTQIPPISWRSSTTPMGSAFSVPFAYEIPTSSSPPSLQTIRDSVAAQ